MREKVLARHAEALLDWKGTLVLSEEIWFVLDEALLRGYLSKTASSLETRCTFLRLGARLGNGTTQAGLVAWTNRLVRTGITTAHQAASARQQFRSAAAEAGDATKKLRLERMALDALDSLLPKASMSIGGVCRQAVAYVRGGSFPSDAVRFVRENLQEGCLHASEGDDDGFGYLLWSICMGLCASPTGDGPTNVFLALLSLLVMSLGFVLTRGGHRRESHKAEIRYRTL
jgi:hypothetical protein